MKTLKRVARNLKIFTTMSYTKIRIEYYGDGIACNGRDTRKGVLKKATIALPKKVTEYGDAHGYSSLSVSYSADHLIIKGGWETLMDKDINASSREYISRLVSYDWCN